MNFKRMLQCYIFEPFDLYFDDCWYAMSITHEFILSFF